MNTVFVEKSFDGRIMHMIEVLFGESEACSMQCAKSLTKQQSRADGPTSMIGNPPQPDGQTKAWTTIAGSPDEVVCLSYMMDIGDIRQPCDSAYRQQLIFGLKYDRLPGTVKEQEARLDMLQYQQFSRLQAMLEEGRPIRVWYSRAPYAYCGLCWLCYELRNREADITVVSLPEYVLREDSVMVQYQSFCEVACEEFGMFLNRQKKLTMQERRMYEIQWIEMLDAATMLRAVVNGKLLGVPEDFYDFLILQRLTKKPQKEARVVGDLLGYSQIAVGDWWYFYRIRCLAREGKIQAAEDRENPGMLLIWHK